MAEDKGRRVTANSNANLAGLQIRNHPCVVRPGQGLLQPGAPRRPCPRTIRSSRWVPTGLPLICNDHSLVTFKRKFDALRVPGTCVVIHRRENPAPDSDGLSSPARLPQSPSLRFHRLNGSMSGASLSSACSRPSCLRGACLRAFVACSSCRPRLSPVGRQRQCSGS